MQSKTLAFSGWQAIEKNSLLRQRNSCEGGAMNDGEAGLVFFEEA